MTFIFILSCEKQPLLTSIPFYLSMSPSLLIRKTLDPCRWVFNHYWESNERLFKILLNKFILVCFQHLFLKVIYSYWAENNTWPIPLMKIIWWSSTKPINITSSWRNQEWRALMNNIITNNSLWRPGCISTVYWLSSWK